MKRKNAYDYFDSFQASAHFAFHAATYLNETLSKFDPNTIEEKVKQLHVIENTADQKKHEMIEHLAHEFIPPIEREDIMAMANQLDEVTDAIEEVIRWIYISRIQKMNDKALELSELAVQCTESLQGAVAEFRNFKKSREIHAKIVEINNQESHGDHLHMRAVRDLFANPKDPLETIVWLNLYERFENCFDACEHVSDIIESTIMKNT